MARSILVVDDSEADRYIATRLISRSTQFDHVYALTDGEEAFEHFRDFDDSLKKKGEFFPPSIVLLDINMPRMNGFEFLEKYQEMLSDEKYQVKFVAMLTSSENDEDIANARKYPFVKSFLKKPFCKEHIEKLSKMLDETS